MAHISIEGTEWDAANVFSAIQPVLEVENMSVTYSDANPSLQERVFVEADVSIAGHPHRVGLPWEKPKVESRHAHHIRLDSG